jgi:hypothetical protein
MKKQFINALIETVLFDEKDIITTSGLVDETLGTLPPESTAFVPGTDGIHGEDIPLN